MCHDSFFDERLHYFAYNQCKADWPVVFRFVLRTFLYIGETFALFHSVGISPSSIVLFRKSEIGFDRLSASTIRSLGWTLSGPHDLFTFKFLLWPSHSLQIVYRYLHRSFLSSFGMLVSGSRVKTLENCFWRIFALSWSSHLADSGSLFIIFQ